MQSYFWAYRSSRIHYLQAGTGRKLLLCFHGYGESAEAFSFLEQSVGEDFTILAIDLPFHGDTDWKEGLYFNPADLLELIRELVAGLPGAGDRWWLLGYSMGGRIALQLLEQIPEGVEKMVLLAPDGLRVNGWYWLATQTNAGNRLFRWTMSHPGWSFFVLTCGEKLGLANRSVYKFVHHYIENPQVREELYIRWTTLRGFRPDIPAIQAIIREKQIPVRLLYGLHDRIIRWERGERFRKKGGLESYCQLSFLPAGHQLLQAKNLETVLSLLKD